ncbi:MAG TPA: chromate resistance protein ChrB domain-containing protein [Candidatus Eisenbacteria bacterium]|nr:chromate resistance protein ChrB domain-containing protein [Candidatus Eisenbacteria bacterium]
MAAESEAASAGWIALIAERMPRLAADRVHVRRSLRRIGAVAVRDGVYALPDGPGARAAMAAAGRQLERRRGKAMPCVVLWLDARDHIALDRGHARELERRRRQALAQIERLEGIARGTVRARPSDRRTAGARLARLRRRLAQEAPPAAAAPAASPAKPAPDDYRARVWVTRRGVLVDRIASAWLIRRFVDPAARFRFVAPGDAIAPGELRFDMAGGEFTHEGDRCTFETLTARLQPRDTALRQMAETVHDLDLKDGKYGRAEGPGLASFIAGLAAIEADDHARLERGWPLFDCLYASFRGVTPHVPKGVLP